MNGKKILLISLWRKGFLIFLQRQRSLVLRQYGLTQWSDSFRKRLENIYLASMAHRIEIKRFPWDCAVVLRLPIIFRNPLRSHTYGKSRIYVDKGITHYLYTIPNTILKERIGIVSFLRAGRMSVFNRDIIRFKKPYKRTALGTLLRAGRIPVFNRDIIRSKKPYKRTALGTLYGDMHYDRADFGMAGNLISGSGEFRLNIDQIHHTIRSMKPHQRMTMREKYVDVQYDRADSGLVKNLISGSGEFKSNMDQFYRDQRRNYFSGSEDHNSSEVSKNSLLKPESLHLKYKGNKGKYTGRTGRVSLTRTRRILMVNQDAIRSMKPYKRAAMKSGHGDMTYGDMQYERTNPGMTRSMTSDPGEFSSSMDQIQQKHLPVVPFREERVDSVQADTIYAIPPWTQAKAKRSGERFNSILTSDKTREFSRPLSLNAEREMSLYKIIQTQNPFWERKETGKTGISIDYNKVADRVYEILTRRIIREKERMGELI